MNKDAEKGLVIVIGALLAVGGFMLGLAYGLGLAALQAFILMLCWNFTMPALFGLPFIGFFQMWALMILIGFIARWFRRNS